MKASIITGALALGLVTASPLTDDVLALERRQLGKGKGLAGGRGLASFLGDPGATEAFTTLARLMGANKNSGGNLGTIVTGLNAGYGKVADPPGAAPKRVVLQPKTDTPGAKTVKIRYGPYKVPNMGKKNMLGLSGMLFNYPHKNVERPCSGNCTLLSIVPGLEYADGTNANIDTGLWLHHMILFTSGPGREDRTCNHRDISVPHAVIGMTPRNSERVFGSGNERSNIVLPAFGVKDAGYKLRAADQFHFVLEFMNQNMQDKVVYLTMTYDYVPGHPFKDDIRPLWFDVRQCGTSEVNPPKGKSQFSLDSNWTASFDGRLIGTGGHLHDGGTRTLLTVDGKLVCDSTATYGGKPEFISATTGGHGGHSGPKEHLSKMHLCGGKEVADIQMKKGQTWRLQADYDFNKFKGMTNEDGSWDEVMGIQLAYVRVPS